MRTLVRAVTIVFLLSGVAGIAAAQRGWVDIELGRRPSVRGHVVIGPRYHYNRYSRPHIHRHYRRPYVVGPRLHYRRPVVIYRGHRGHRSHYRWY
jgi:hypothetical protein